MEAIILIWVIAILTGVIFAAKGRSFWTGLCIGLAFSVIALVVALFLPSVKKCPQCKESIKVKVTKCNHCGYTYLPNKVYVEQAQSAELEVPRAIPELEPGRPAQKSPAILDAQQLDSGKYDVNQAVTSISQNGSTHHQMIPCPACGEQTPPEEFCSWCGATLKQQDTPSVSLSTVEQVVVTSPTPTIQPDVCANCNEQLIAESAFCGWCGAPVEPQKADPVQAACPDCGRDLPPGQDTCQMCKTLPSIPRPVEPPPAAVKTQPAAPNPPSAAIESDVCPVCGYKSPAGSTFCNGCGTLLELAKIAAAESQIAANFSNGSGNGTSNPSVPLLPPALAVTTGNGQARRILKLERQFEEVGSLDNVLADVVYDLKRAGVEITQIKSDQGCIIGIPPPNFMNIPDVTCVEVTVVQNHASGKMACTLRLF